MAGMERIDRDRLARALESEYSGWRTYKDDGCGGKPESCNGHAIPIEERREEAERIAALYESDAP